MVTGGSAGLGRHIAEAFARHGARVIILARDAARLQATVDGLRSDSRDVTGIPADITRQDDVDRAFATIHQQYGRLDVLVNNAGRSMRAAASETTPEQFRELLDLNLLALVRCTRAAMPHLKESRGHLVNIGSLSSRIATPPLGAYPASKFAVAAYSQQLRLELGPAGVHVLLVCPGPIARDEAQPRYQDQIGHLPPEAGRPGGGAKVSAVSPEKLAAKIVRASQRRQPELVVPSKARLLFAIVQLWPTLGDWLVRRLT